METFNFAPGIFFLILLAVAVIGFIAGWKMRKEKDKPVLIIDENIPHHSEQVFNHVHPHDQKK